MPPPASAILAHSWTARRCAASRNRNACRTGFMSAPTAAGTTAECRGYSGSRDRSAFPRFQIPSFAMSIFTGRELEFLVSLNDSWARLYRTELARLLHKVDDRCDAHQETRSIIRISAAPSSH